MARVRLRDGESDLQGGVALRCAARILQRLAGMPSVADHIESAVPPGRQTHLERNLGIEHAGDPAVRRRCAGRGDRRCRDLHDLLRLELIHCIAGLRRLDVRLPSSLQARSHIRKV